MFFEKVLETRRAQIEFKREFAHGARRPSLRPLQYFLQMLSMRRAI
jgi:hypothetical protein